MVEETDTEQSESVPSSMERKQPELTEWSQELSKILPTVEFEIDGEKFNLKSWTDTDAKKQWKLLQSRVEPELKCQSEAASC